MADTFLITGSRPPSARSRSRQSVIRPKSGYKTVSESSEVDELLFQSNNRVSDGHRNIHTPVHVNYNTEYPNGTWANKVPMGKRDKPLLWAPTSTMDKHNILHSSHTALDSAKQKYRLRKHTPTFVDETLFGPKLEEPSFEAPWSAKTKKTRPYLFSSTDYTKCSTPASSFGGATLGSEFNEYGVDGRPPSRMGPRPASTRNRPFTVEVPSTKTVWKP